MGVKACNRMDCENAMCDEYVEGVGYICYDCIEEFKAHIGDVRISRKEMVQELKKFMDTPKLICGGDANEIVSVDEFFGSDENNW